MSDLERSEALCDVGRYEDALEFAQRAVASEPTDVAALCQLASVYHSLRRYPEALVTAGKAIAQDPEVEWAHRIRALALMATRKPRPALAAAQECVRLAPFVVEAHYVLSEVQVRNRQFAAALDSAETCISLDPESPLGHNAVASACIRMKKWRDAELACRRALAVDPEDVAARYNLGVALSRQRGRGAEGVAHLTEAAKLEPHNRATRDAAVAAGRKYVAGGFFGIYLLVRFASTTVRSRDDSDVLALLLLGVMVILVAAFWIRRHRRLKQLPSGVAELIRRGDWSIGARLGTGIFWAAVAIAVFGVVALVSAPKVGLFMIAAGALMAFVARWRTVPR